MAIIGTLKLGADDKTFSGELTTLTLSRKIRMVPIDSNAADAPDYRVFCGTAEIGVAWQKESHKATTYYAVKFDDPALPGPFWANLVESSRDSLPAVWNLLWDRQKPRN